MHRTLAKLSIGFAVAAIVAAGGVLWWTQRPAKPNLILISVDTLRADRLGSYGYARQTSPAMDRIASEGVVFEQALSVSSWTLPTHVTMFTGLYPTTHGVTRSRGRKIAETTPTLGQVMARHGYRNFGFTDGGFVSKLYGFGRGFEVYEQLRGVRDRREFFFPGAVDRAIEKLRSVSEPYFLFLHTYDVHCPYSLDAPYDTMFVSDNRREIDPSRCGESFYNLRKMSAEEGRYLSDMYDGSIRFVDDQLGRFFDYLRTRDDYSDTIIIITSDHGEEFLEHGQIGHQKSLHRELLMIPLIIKAPGFESGRVPAQVSNVDLFPTIVDLLKLNHPFQMDGVSLAGLMRGESSGLRPFQFSELDRGAKIRSHFDPRGHLLWYSKQKEKRYYDSGDLLQSRDLGSTEDAELAFEELQQFLGQLKKSSGGKLGRTDAEHLEQLKTLGYL